MKKRLLWLVGGLCVFLQLTAGAALAYTVTGTIQNSSGSSGRVYVFIASADGSSPYGYGTSIANVANGGSAGYTIHGVPAGQYSIAASVDRLGTGSLHINDPVNTTSGFSVNSDQTAPALTLLAPAATVPTAVGKVNVVTTTNGALVVWKGPQSPYGGGGPNAELADSYVVYWGTSQNPGNGGTPLGSRTVTANGGDYHVFVNNLTGSLYFGVKAVNQQGSAYSATGQPYTIAAQAGGATVTGRVYSSGISKASAPLYIAMKGQTTNNFYIGGLSGPVPDTATWSITGIQPDTYSVYVILDLNNSGFASLIGEATSRGNNDNLPVISVTVPQGATAAAAPDVTLTAPNSKTFVQTQSYNNQSYGLQFFVAAGLKQPVSVMVNNGPNLSSPIDLALALDKAATFGDSGPQVSFNTRPSVGDTYSVTVGYADGTSETLSPQVTGVVTTLAQPIFPTGSTTTISSNTSLLAWRAPGLAAGYVDYSLWVSDTNYNQIWAPQNNSDHNMPATQLFLPYNADNSASQQQLTAGNTYTWTISLNDGLGNQGQNQVTFTPQSSGPTISGFSPAGGATGTSVTINGTGFTGASGVKFGGVPAAFTVISNVQISATVPTNAPVGPVTVTAGGITAGSPSAFQATTTFSNYLVNRAAGTPISGATVTIVGSNPPVTTTTDGTGYFTLSVPAGVPYSLDISAPGYHDIITATFAHSTPSVTSSSFSYKSYTDADAAALGFSLASKGLIASHVIDWDTLADISGATVTATSFLHPDTPYTVYYSNPSSGAPVTGAGTATGTDGLFYVPNVDEGDIVTVTPSVAGESPLPRTYVTHIGVVSETSPRVTPLPIVTASPAGGAITASQQVTLSVSNRVTGDNYTIYYTTDGSDPTVPGTRTTVNAPSASLYLSVGSVTLKFYAVNTTHGIAGNVATASFTVTPGTYNLNVVITGGGTISDTNQSGPTFSCNSPNCGGPFSAGSPFTLHATPSASYLFGGWAGTGSASGCTGTGDCSFTLSADTSVSATFNPIPPVKVPGTPDAYFQSLGSAYASAAPGSSLTIDAQATTFTENLGLSNSVNLTFLGGYDSSFTTPSGMTALQGSLTVGFGSITVQNLSVK